MSTSRVSVLFNDVPNENEAMKVTKKHNIASKEIRFNSCKNGRFLIYNETVGLIGFYDKKKKELELKVDRRALKKG